MRKPYATFTVYAVGSILFSLLVHSVYTERLGARMPPVAEVAVPITGEPPPWSAQLIGAYGGDDAVNALTGLDFLAHTVSPVKLSNSYHNVLGDTLAGDVLIMSIVTDTTWMTVTARLDDVVTYDQLVLHCQGYTDLPIGAAATVSSTVDYVTCVLGGGVPCQLRARLIEPQCQ